MAYQKYIRLETPPTKWRFTCPETGYKIENQHTKQNLFELIQRHYDDNGIDLPEDWQQRVEDQLCRQLPAGFCQYTDGGNARGFQPDLSAEKIFKGISSLASMIGSVVTGKSIFVEQEEANRRAEICSRCYYNIESSFCAGCATGRAITETVAKVRGDRSTPHDNNLLACGICGCKNVAIVHIKKELMLSGESKEMTEARPSWCWMKNDDLTKAEEQLKI